MSTTNVSNNKHAGPNPGVVAIVYTLLFYAGLYFVISFTGGPHFPGPWESSETIAAYFQGHPTALLICAFLQFGAAVPLGIFTATMVSRLQFLGVRVAGAHIALFGGLMTAFNMAASALVLWVMAYSGIAQDAAVLRALYYLTFAFGGVGFSVPLGLLMAGVCIPAAFFKLLPKWLVVFGLVLAVIGELSALSLVIPKAAVSHSAHPLSGIYLVDRCGIRAAENAGLGKKEKLGMKKSILPGCVIGLLLMTGLGGCEKKSGDAVVIGKDYVAAVKQGEEIKDERATKHEQCIVKARMLDNGPTIQIHADRAEWEKLREGDRVKVTYRVGKYTGTVWDAEITLK